MHDQIIVHAIQRFGLVFKKLKTIIWLYLVKLKVAFKNTLFWCSICAITYKMTSKTWNWLNLKDTVNQHALQCHSAIWGVFFKKYQWPTILDETIERKFKRKKKLSEKTHLHLKLAMVGIYIWVLRKHNCFHGQITKFKKSQNLSVADNFCQMTVYLTHV